MLKRLGIIAAAAIAAALAIIFTFTGEKGRIIVIMTAVFLTAAALSAIVTYNFRRKKADSNSGKNGDSQ